jgi:hypothetical protein
MPDDSQANDKPTEAPGEATSAPGNDSIAQEANPQSADVQSAQASALNTARQTLEALGLGPSLLGLNLEEGNSLTGNFADELAPKIPIGDIKLGSVDGGVRQAIDDLLTSKQTALEGAPDSNKQQIEKDIAALQKLARDYAKGGEVTQSLNGQINSQRTNPANLGSAAVLDHTRASDLSLGASNSAPEGGNLGIEPIVSAAGNLTQEARRALNAAITSQIKKLSGAQKLHGTNEQFIATLEEARDRTTDAGEKERKNEQIERMHQEQADLVRKIAELETTVKAHEGVLGKIETDTHFLGEVAKQMQLEQSGKGEGKRSATREVAGRESSGKTGKAALGMLIFATALSLLKEKEAKAETSSTIPYEINN